MIDAVEYRRSVGNTIQSIFPRVRVDFVKDVLEYDRLPVPLVTYFMEFTLATNRRPTWTSVTKDMDNLTGKVTQYAPYDITLIVGVHSNELLENEKMRWDLFREWGRVPCINGVGYRMREKPLDVPKEKWGLYSTYFYYVGWAYAEGPSEESPLITRIELGHGHHTDPEGVFNEEVVIEAGEQDE